MRLDHDYVAEHDLVGRYMAGTLPSDERARFEAHFVDCPHCLDALEDVEPFRSALRVAAGLQSVRPQADVWLTPDATRTLILRAGALAAAVVLAVGIADSVRLRREVARAKATAEVVARQLADAEQRVRELAATNGPRAERPDAAAPADVLVFPLVKTRGAGGGSPQNRVALSGDAVWIVLLADLNAPSASSRYRATLGTADGRPVWSNDRLRQSSADAVGVAVPSHLLSDGDYILTLDEQPAASNTWQPAGRYTFRVVHR